MVIARIRQKEAVIGLMMLVSSLKMKRKVPAKGRLCSPTMLGTAVKYGPTMRRSRETT